MRVLITGGSGLIGRHLARTLLEQGHQPVILSRNADHVRRDPEMWAYQVVPGDPTSPGRWQEEVDGCDAVVNLAGHNLFAERWSATVKAKIRDSRVHSAEQVVSAMKQAHSRPQVFIQGSAIGYYGPHRDEELTEASPSGSDFLAVVCRETEEASESLEGLGVRRAVVRTGIVLAPNDGALRIMTPMFKFLPGVPIGSNGRLGAAEGQQWMSWIHIEDIVGILRLAIENPEAVGPINGTASHPVRNAEFAKTLSAVLRNRATPWRFFFPFGPPDAMLQLFLGEVAQVIATGQKVLPTKALQLGYSFRYPELAGACARSSRVSQSTPKHPLTPSRPVRARTTESRTARPSYLRVSPSTSPATNVSAAVRIAPASALRGRCSAKRARAQTMRDTWAGLSQWWAVAAQEWQP